MTVVAHADRHAGRGIHAHRPIDVLRAWAAVPAAQGHRAGDGQDAVELQFHTTVPSVLPRANNKPRAVI
jgi:hypothetical protein